jgi:hypothetical protein
MKAIMAAAVEHTYRMVDLINVENAHEPDSGGHHPRRRPARMALSPGGSPAGLSIDRSKKPASWKPSQFRLCRKDYT